MRKTKSVVGWLRFATQSMVSSWIVVGASVPLYANSVKCLEILIPDTALRSQIIKNYNRASTSRTLLSIEALLKLSSTERVPILFKLLGISEKELRAASVRFQLSALRSPQLIELHKTMIAREIVRAKALSSHTSMTFNGAQKLWAEAVDILLADQLSYEGVTRLLELVDSEGFINTDKWLLDEPSDNRAISDALFYTSKARFIQAVEEGKVQERLREPAIESLLMRTESLSRIAVLLMLKGENLSDLAREIDINPKRFDRLNPNKAQQIWKEKLLLRLTMATGFTPYSDITLGKIIEKLNLPSSLFTLGSYFQFFTGRGAIALSETNVPRLFGIKTETDQNFEKASLETLLFHINRKIISQLREQRSDLHLDITGKELSGALVLDPELHRSYSMFVKFVAAKEIGTHIDGEPIRQVGLMIFDKLDEYFENKGQQEPSNDEEGLFEDEIFETSFVPDDIGNRIESNTPEFLQRQFSSPIKSSVYNSHEMRIGPNGELLPQSQEIVKTQAESKLSSSKKDDNIGNRISVKYTESSEDFGNGEVLPLNSKADDVELSGNTGTEDGQGLSLAEKGMLALESVSEMVSDVVRETLSNVGDAVTDLIGEQEHLSTSERYERLIQKEFAELLGDRDIVTAYNEIVNNRFSSSRIGIRVASKSKLNSEVILTTKHLLAEGRHGSSYEYAIQNVYKVFSSYVEAKSEVDIADGVSQSAVKRARENAQKASAPRPVSIEEYLAEQRALGEEAHEVKPELEQAVTTIEKNTAPQEQINSESAPKVVDESVPGSLQRAMPVRFSVEKNPDGVAISELEKDIHPELAESTKEFLVKHLQAQSWDHLSDLLNVRVKNLDPKTSQLLMTTYELLSRVNRAYRLLEGNGYILSLSDPIGQAMALARGAHSRFGESFTVGQAANIAGISENQWKTFEQAGNFVDFIMDSKAPNKKAEMIVKAIEKLTGPTWALRSQAIAALQLRAGESLGSGISRLHERLIKKRVSWIMIATQTKIKKVEWQSLIENFKDYSSENFPYPLEEWGVDLPRAILLLSELEKNIR